MNSASTDRSISSAISLPQWMKTKISDRYDLEQATFSPPNEDDSFFFIRYPLASESKMNSKVDVDSTKQTNQNFLSDSSSEGKMKRSATVPDSQLKSMGTDDNSGRSMVSVAQNMITGKIFGSYLSADKNGDFVYHNRNRRNSKSLPASPLSSPKICRKNPYFTDPFARPDETFEAGKSGWIMSILSQRKSVEDLTGDTYSSASETNSPKIPRHTPKLLSEPKPKPSELREMNFWSPVSM